MRIAILADIHSNLEALEKAVAYLKDQKIEEWFVLGDTVGYGANPNECYQWAIDHADLNIMGNHEKAVIDPSLREWFSPHARDAIIWTEDVLKPDYKKAMAQLPFVKIEKGVTYTHGDLDAPEEFRYLTSFTEAQPSFQKMENPICFVAHTHVPACFCESKRSADYLEPGVLTLEQGERYILNPGSVGQPRDRDPRLALGIFDDARRTFEIVRLSYDNHKAADKIRKAGLPQYLADRLLG